MTSVSENVRSSQDIQIVTPMTTDEARAHVQAVNTAAADMGRHLLELKEREGWRALGYANWTACLQNEFGYSRQHLYDLMDAAPVQERLSGTPYKLSTRAAVALAAYDADLQPAILRTAAARYGKLTESNVTRVGNIVETMARTGHVDTGSGVSTPVDGALTAEDNEALNRQKQYIAESGGRMVDPTTGEIVERTPPQFVFKFEAEAHIPSGFTAPTLIVPQEHKLVSSALTVGRRYRVKVFEL
jgi:hypothetical protein